VPILDAPMDDDPDNGVIVKFIFIYTTSGNFCGLLENDIIYIAITEYIETLEDIQASPSPRLRKSAAEGRHKRPSKRRRLSPVNRIKTDSEDELEQKMSAEIRAYEEKAHSIRIALEARRRARGETVEVSGVRAARHSTNTEDHLFIQGDKGNPIKVED
jgi:hypothetical protein